MLMRMSQSDILDPMETQGALYCQRSLLQMHAWESQWEFPMGAIVGDMALIAEL